MRQLHRFLLPLLSVMLIACTSQAGDSAEIASAEPTSTLEASSTTTLHVTILATATETPSYDQINATQTGLAESRVHATERPTATPTPTQTPLPTITPLAEIPPLNGFEAEETRGFTSPDGQWIVHTIHAIPIETSAEHHRFFSYIAVEKVDGSDQWIIEAFWEEMGMSNPWPEPYRWSNDGESLYFSHDIIPDGCEVPYVKGWDLYRADLSTRSVTQILPFGEVKGFSLSPDESLVALVKGQLFVRVLETGIEQQVEYGNFGVLGNIVWAPDQSSALFVDGTYCSIEPEHAILRVDWAENRVVELIPRSTDAYRDC